MTRPVNIPKLGLTMEEAVVVEWHREDGQRVGKGEILVTIETEKVNFDVEAEADGFVQRVAAVGDRLKVGELCGHLHETADAALRAARTAPPATAATAVQEVPQAAREVQSAVPAEAAGHPARLASLGKGAARILASPVARVVAHDRRIALDAVQGTGPGGVILKRDVLHVVPASAGARSAAPAARSAAMPAPAAGTSTRRPMSSMRRTISQRMAHSLASTAQMTGFGRIDMAAAADLRAALVAQEAQLGARITYTDLVLKACACVLAGMPEINASIDGEDIVTWNEVNIGLAVAVDEGLLVPVIRNVDRLSLVEVCRERLRVIERARAGTLTREDIEGGTFTLSNFGSYGGDFETPILNVPQSALLGIGRIADEPVVRDRQIVIRPMMMISLTFDHRLVDGATAGRFRSRLREFLEQPGLMLAQLR